MSFLLQLQPGGQPYLTGFLKSAGMDSPNDISLMIPFIVTAASGIILSLQALIRFMTKTRQSESDDRDRSSDSKEYMLSRGGHVIVGLRFLQLVGSVILLFLSFRTTYQNTGDLGTPLMQYTYCSNALLIITYLYCVILSVVSLVNNDYVRVLSFHYDTILLMTFGIYVYRDLWPLATYTRRPLDEALGPILWTQLATLFAIGFLIPLFIPRQYIPIDPKNPMETLNPEQTASVASLLTYIFMDPLVLKAYRVPHLSHAQLPPLADYDYSRHLVDSAFPHLDVFRGAKKQHLVYGLLYVYAWECTGIVVSILILTIAKFSAPIALNRILATLESTGTDDSIRPWFWVLLLFSGHIISSISFQTYVYICTIITVRVQAILTELLFEHNLRIRSNVEENSKPSTQSGSTDTASSSKKTNNVIGKINTMVSVDVSNVGSVKDFFMIVIQGALELVLSAIFLYKILGWSAIAWFISILLLLPIPGFIGKRMQRIQQRRMQKTDARVQTVTETIGVLRMIKMFGWESKMRTILDDKREEELVWLWKFKLIGQANYVLNFIIPMIATLITYGIHTLIRGQSLDASTVFSTISVFDIARNVLRRTSFMLNEFIRGKSLFYPFHIIVKSGSGVVSLNRIEEYLNTTELLDEFSDQKGSLKSLSLNAQHAPDVIGFNNAEFTWATFGGSSNEGEQGQSIPSRSFRLRTKGRVEFKRGSINLIVGPTGAGKTSILMALLGEMHFEPVGADSWYSLPRGGGVSYAAQESWVQNDTVKNNIMFGLPYDEERYKKVIYQCDLTRDLALFEAGDETEIGERGLTLSGGQKARVTLARAVYSSAEIILLDDILAALDVHTAKWVVKECLQGDLVRRRTVILVTHNIPLASPISDHIVSIGLDGVAHEIGTDMATALTADPDLAIEAAQFNRDEQKDIDADNRPPKEVSKTGGKLTLAEEISLGHVSGSSYMLLLKGLGGDHPILFMTAWLAGISFMQIGYMLSVWFLGYWGSMYNTHHPEDVRSPYYISMYSVILFGAIISYTVGTLVYNAGTLRAARKINGQLIESILTSTLRWMDETPTSRIISRCAQDISTVDGPLTANLGQVVDLTISIIVKLSGPVILAPVLALPALSVAIFGAFLGNVYLKAQLSVKREMSNARSPIIGHIGAAIGGLVSIRAYGAQGLFIEESLKRIDHFTKVARPSFNLNRWIGVRMDILSATFTTALASYMLINRHLNAANTGFSLTMALEFCGSILWCVRYFNDLEVQANSLERINQYLDIDHEPASTVTGKPPAAWPKSGELQVEGLSARYSANGPDILHDVSFKVKSGERIGIVGRTGSGKSSLTLSLLRFIPTEGSVNYDGLPTNDLNLDELRSNITIIPQMPELLSGTLRRNLDPFEQHDDPTLNDALRSAGLFSLQNEGDPNNLTLDTDVSSGGNNLSVGQRQIIALARAILRRSKLLILDEATSAIDHKTDSIIQSSLRNELGSDVTVLTVAHRLQTIMDADKVLVLKEGRIVEFDSPQALLKKATGHFKSLVDESEDRKELYAMAENKQTVN